MLKLISKWEEQNTIQKIENNKTVAAKCERKRKNGRVHNTQTKCYDINKCNWHAYVGTLCVCDNFRFRRRMRREKSRNNSFVFFFLKCIQVETINFHLMLLLLLSLARCFYSARSIQLLQFQSLWKKGSETRTKCIYIYVYKKATTKQSIIVWPTLCESFFFYVCLYSCLSICNSNDYNHIITTKSTEGITETTTKTFKINNWARTQ